MAKKLLALLSASACAERDDEFVEALLQAWAHVVEEGKRNTEIAEILGLSVHTVRKHLENIFVKLEVETRTAAVAAFRNGE